MAKILTVSLFVAFASSAFAAAPASSPEMIAKGKAAFTTNCVVCHGDKGDGNGVAGAALNPKPANFTDAAYKYKGGNTPEKLFKTVSEGLPGTAMTAFGHLPEQDRWALVHYIRSLKK